MRAGQIQASLIAYQQFRPYLKVQCLTYLEPKGIPPRAMRKSNPSFLNGVPELLVLQLLAQGYTNQQIADRINIRVKTVETYRSRLGEKLGLRNRADFTQYAFKMGLLTSDNFTMEDN